MRPFLAYLLLLCLCWALGRRSLRGQARLVLGAVLLHWLLGLLILRTAAGRVVFACFNDAVGALLAYTDEGTRFLVGPYLDAHFTVALRVLPTVVFFSALVAVAYHFGVLQRIVGAIAWVMRRTLRTSGRETLPAAANIFVGPTEAPLLVKPYLAEMRSDELFAVMVAGFSTVSGGVLGAYVGLLSPQDPEIAGRLLAASVMNAPAALLVAKLIMPAPKAHAPEPRVTYQRDSANAVEALANGARDGLMLALNVAAMLLVFVALVALIDGLLALGQWALVQGFDLQLSAQLRLRDVLRWCFTPLSWLIAPEARDVAPLAMLLGKKVALNELLAFQSLAEMMQAQKLSPRGAMVAVFALCSFANLGTIAIQVGGLGTLAPTRRSEIAKLGFKAMCAGALVPLLSASIAQVFN